MAGGWVFRDIEASYRTLWLSLGDLAMIALFVGLGELRHAGTIAAGLRTFGQFGLGWILVSPLAGAYSDWALDGRWRPVGLIVITWTIAAVIGQLIRLVMTPRTVVQPAFLAVTIAIGGAFLAGWRLIAMRTLA